MQLEFKIRCSAIGKIMGVRGLGKTGESFCEDWLKEQIYSRHKEFDSKYTQKGNEVEDNSIEFIAENLDYGFLIKNEEHFEDEFMCGTPDIITSKHIIDVKNSWDCFTFPIFDKEIQNKDYFYQLHGYMHLTGIKKAKLVYCLMDTPEHLIEREARNYSYKNGYGELDKDTYDSFYDKMTYRDIPIHQRIKVFEFDYDEKVIEKIKERVLECRNYINSIYK